MPDQGLTVVVLGASDKPERYSNRAVRMLLEHGHEVIPVHPSLQTEEGLTVVPSLARVPRPVDTLTVYVSPTIGATLGQRSPVPCARTGSRRNRSGPELHAGDAGIGELRLRTCTGRQTRSGPSRVTCAAASRILSVRA